jgi:NAD(P)-dependent dehydrogenase (short-subunit alcohol dehydrogenase family)
MNLRQPVVCISGASRGIGRAVAEAFASRGARLLLLARSEALCGVAAKLGRHSEVAAVRCDISRFEPVREAIDQAVTRWGGIDVLVNAAAILGATGEIWTTDPGEWAAAVNVNLIGTYHTMRAAIPHMRQARSGKIVNFAGGGAAYGYPLFSSYGSSKAAVVRLTETVAMECAPYGIQVNAVAPGAIETEMLRAVRAAGGEVKTIGTMQEAVDVVLFLADGGSEHLSGRFIHARDAYREFPPQLAADCYTLRRVQP